MNIWFHPAKEFDNMLRNAASKIQLENFDPQMRTADPRFGDFQSNGVLPMAKMQKTNPRALAQTLVDELKKDENFDESLVEVSIAGPGFINFALTKKFLNAWLAKYKGEAELKNASKKFYNGKKVVIDYPSPNTAKQMHVGHLRPMVIGEAVKRLLKFCGADIKTDNHIGDWGTNFGILIYGIKTQNYKLDPNNENSLEELEQMYKRGSALTKENPEAADAARAELVKLQNGDAENVELWNEINKVSTVAFERMYKRMGLTIDMTLGESYYRDKVGRIYQELSEIGLAEENQGALVVFHKEHERFAKQPFIIRKSDGASNYASTDLATILNRVENLDAEEVVYVTDGRQQDHFQQLFITVEKWFKAKAYKLPQMRHVWFGTILGEDGKAIKTKSGEPIRLKALLDEAVARAKALVKEKNPDVSEDDANKIAETIGVAAIRYSDLAQNRTGDYVFSWDKLLAFDGNTAPYLLYAAARIHSIFRKIGTSPDCNFPEASELETEQEIALARKLIALPSVFELTLSELRPHFLCTYLYELAGIFSTFYNANKVIVDDEGTKQRRLMLCARTLRVLEAGLRLLGIEPLEKM
ncbi:MAG: arginine--tRNA ligase [Verrucomicrobiaceae bacterium]|nr:arginine--tRNA ligase [Verrucomicrobiaceae bacterium]